MKTTMTKRVKVIAVAIVGALMMIGASAEIAAKTGHGAAGDHEIIEAGDTGVERKGVSALSRPSPREQPLVDTFENKRGMPPTRHSNPTHPPQSHKWGTQ